MKSLFFAILMLCLAPVPPARAQIDPQVAQAAAGLDAGSPALQGLLRRSTEPGVPPEFVAAVLSEARGMRDRGLPTEAFMLKANEGLAKGVPPRRIAPGLRTSRERTEDAARLVDAAAAREGRALPPEVRSRAIESYQAALLNGVSPRALRGIAGPGLSSEQLGIKARELTPRRHGVVMAPRAAPLIPAKPHEEKALAKEPEFRGQEKSKAFRSEKKETREQHVQDRGEKESKEWQVQKGKKAWEPGKNKGYEGTKGRGHGRGNSK